MTRKMKNPVTGVEVEILVATEESKGKRFKFRSTMKANQLNKAPYHFHSTFSELFRVEDGQLNVIVGRDKQQMVLHAGESYLVEPGCPHTFWNDSSAPVTYTVEVSPACRFEESLKINHELAAVGKASKQGTPANLFHMALLSKMGNTYLHGIPLRLQQSAFLLLGGIAKLLGIDKKLQKLL